MSLLPLSATVRWKFSFVLESSRPRGYPEVAAAFANQSVRPPQNGSRGTTAGRADGQCNEQTAERIDPVKRVLARVDGPCWRPEFVQFVKKFPVRAFANL